MCLAIKKLIWGQKGRSDRDRPLDRYPAFDRLSPTLIRSHLFNFGLMIDVNFKAKFNIQFDPIFAP
jgi:hypothetical protein